MTGCLLARACFVACLFGESSQQWVPPHSWHVRKWTHSAPVLTHSSHSRRFGCLTVVTERIWEQVCSGIVVPSATLCRKSTEGDEGSDPSSPSSPSSRRSLRES